MKDVHEGDKDNVDTYPVTRTEESTLIPTYVPPSCLIVNFFVTLKLHEICLEKVQPLLIYQERFACQCNLAAKESRLECKCVNNDDFTVRVSPSHSK